jgi:hypothetical protein
MVGADDGVAALERRRELVAGFGAFARASANAPAMAQVSNGHHHANQHALTATTLLITRRDVPVTWKDWYITSP